MGLFGGSFGKGLDKTFGSGGLLGGNDWGSRLQGIGQGLSLLSGGGQDGQDPQQSLIAQLLAQHRAQQQAAANDPTQQPNISDPSQWTQSGGPLSQRYGQPMPYLNNPYRQRWM